MKEAIKRMLRAAVAAAGFEIKRREDPYRLDIYERLHDASTLARKPFYNIGAGSFSHPYWTSIDYDSDWYGKGRDIVHHDLMSLQPLPIETGAAKIIYTSHTIEHVTDEAVAKLFHEAFRALEEGGVFRVTTGPDAETDFRAMITGDDDWFYWDRWYDTPGSYEHMLRQPATSVPLEERWLHHVASQLAPNQIEDCPKVSTKEVRDLVSEKGMVGALDHLASKVRFNPDMPGNHISWWTHGKIENLMRDAGFRTIYRSGYRQSASPLMRQSDLFDSTHPQMSIYMEAVR